VTKPMPNQTAGRYSSEARKDLSRVAHSVTSFMCSGLFAIGQF